MSSLASINSHRQTEPRIDSPMVKYTTKGDLLCALCGKVIKPASLKLWNAHLVSVKHKEMVASLRNSISDKNEKVTTTNTIIQQTKAPEEIIAPLVAETAKPLKSILKNKRRPSEEPILFTKIAVGIDSSLSNPIDNVNENVVPVKVPKMEADNDVSSSSVMTSNDTAISELESMDESHDTSVAQVSELPAGFFDDPKLDAKARNVEFVDPIEKEFQEFQKIIQQEETIAENIELEETTLMLHEREIEQIEGQMSYFARAANIFEQKRQQENHQKLFANEHLSKTASKSTRQFENATANMDTREVIAHFLKLESDSKPDDRKERIPFANNDDVISKVTNGMRESIVPDSIYARNFVKEEPSDSEDEGDLADLDFVNWRKKSLITE